MKVHKLSKFKIGDIIVKDGYTYVCRIVGKKESYFVQKWFKGLFKNPDKTLFESGCNGGENFKCENNLILNTDKTYYDTPQTDRNAILLGSNLYPVIGTESFTGSVSFNLRRICYYYIEDYKNYVKHLHSELPTN